MSGWIEHAGSETEVPVAGTLVDVLYEDEATYQTIMAEAVDWHRAINPVVLWRRHEGRLES